MKRQYKIDGVSVEVNEDLPTIAQAFTYLLTPGYEKDELKTAIAFVLLNASDSQFGRVVFYEDYFSRTPPIIHRVLMMDNTLIVEFRDIPDLSCVDKALNFPEASLNGKVISMAIMNHRRIKDLEKALDQLYAIVKQKDDESEKGPMNQIHRMEE